MPQSLSQVWIHLVFSTKERRPFLQNELVRTEMFKMLAHLVKEVGCVSASVGGYVDHVHLLIGMSRTVTIAKLVEEIKRETSKWVKTHPHGNAIFQWQAGYGVFSVSHSMLVRVDEYIRTQETHHAKRDFRAELEELLRKHEIQFDPKYLE